MKRTLTITLAVAIPVFLSTRIVFPPPEHGPQPEGIQLPLFMVIGAFEALALGLAVATLASASRVIGTLPQAQHAPAWVVTIATTWFLANWWFHDNLHMQVGMDLGGLLALEYGFHVTMMSAGAAIIVALARLARLHAHERSGASTTRTPARQS